MNLRTGALGAAAALVAAALATAAAPAQPGHARGAAAAAQKVTRKGVGEVRLGARYTTLHRKGLVGRLRGGCPLGGPGARTAKLRSPLVGSVELTRSSPRKVRAITVQGGATARGVGIGDAISDITAAYPKAKVDHSTDDVFEVTLVRVPKGGGGRMVFAVSTKTKAIVEIGVPLIAFCE